jgi:hypothetical protein
VLIPAHTQKTNTDTQHKKRDRRRQNPHPRLHPHASLLLCRAAAAPPASSPKVSSCPCLLLCSCARVLVSSPPLLAPWLLSLLAPYRSRTTATVLHGPILHAHAQEGRYNPFTLLPAATPSSFLLPPSLIHLLADTRHSLKRWVPSDAEPNHDARHPWSPGLQVHLPLGLRRPVLLFPPCCLVHLYSLGAAGHWHVRLMLCSLYSAKLTGLWWKCGVTSGPSAVRSAHVASTEAGLEMCHSLPSISQMPCMLNVALTWRLALQLFLILSLGPRRLYAR